MPIPDRLNPTFAASASLTDPRAAALEEARKRLIVALDVPTAPAAIDLVNRLERDCLWFKVGMELFTAAGPAAIESIVARGHSVFLDLKFHDIPNTVAGAVRSAAALGVRMVNVHALGGPAMLAAARQALDAVPDPPQLLAVTILTSMDAAQLRAVSIGLDPSDAAEALARMSLEAGIRGFVCSPQEAARLRDLAGPDATLVIPGVRPAGAEASDQRRIATPAEALRAGASYLVVGRPITQAPDPADAAEAILDEMADALAA
ncbi:MAG TPA: orotidine-5'-phosphate decarboxylase [Terracidiphilus sp.]|nr:orotidine-5'-phosphate decarboxylase [Terracidiphilus sp.]